MKRFTERRSIDSVFSTRQQKRTDGILHHAPRTRDYEEVLMRLFSSVRTLLLGREIGNTPLQEVIATVGVGTDPDDMDSPIHARGE